MQTLELTKNKVAYVDDADFEFVSQYKWHAKKSGNGPWYAARTEKGSDGKRRTVWLHREIANPEKSLFVDHINHDGLDNRRSNLRIVTRKQNRQNSRKSDPQASSKFKGVSWSQARDKWRVRITINGKTRQLGDYACELAAAKAYDTAAIKHFSQYATLNLKDN